MTAPTEGRDAGKKCLSPSMSDVVTAVLECGVGTSDNPADGFIDESKRSM